MARNSHESLSEMKNPVGRYSPTPSTSPRETALQQQSQQHQTNGDNTLAQLPRQRVEVNSQDDTGVQISLQAQEDKSLHVHKNSHAKPHEQAEQNQDPEAEMEAEEEEYEQVPVHSSLTTWVYQTQNSHVTVTERFEKMRWECGSVSENWLRSGVEDTRSGDSGDSDNEVDNQKP